MTAEPRNRASDRTRADLPRWSDRIFIETTARGSLAHSFLHEDRRPLVATPAMDADTYISQLLTALDMHSLELTVDEVLEVRGERLCLVRRSTVREGWTDELLAILQFDEAVDQLERFIGFELTQLPDAVAELDQLYAAIDRVVED